MTLHGFSNHATAVFILCVLIGDDSLIDDALLSNCEFAVVLPAFYRLPVKWSQGVSVFNCWKQISYDSSYSSLLTDDKQQPVSYHKRTLLWFRCYKLDLGKIRIPRQFLPYLLLG